MQEFPEFFLKIISIKSQRAEGKMHLLILTMNKSWIEINIFKLKKSKTFIIHTSPTKLIHFSIKYNTWSAVKMFLLHHLVSLRTLKFIYSEKATKFCEISTLLLSYVVPVKSKVRFRKILWPSQNIWTLISLFFRPEF